MVAARGYGMANALLLAAIAVAVLHTMANRFSLRTSCMIASFALGLSFAANISFAFVDAAAFLAIFIWALRRRGTNSAMEIAAWCALPGLLIVTALCAYPLAHWRSNDSLGAGAKSVADTIRSVADDSLFQLNPRFSKTGWYKTLTAIKPLLLPLLAILCVCQILVTRVDGSWLQTERTRRLGRFAAALACIAAVSVLLHWLAFRLVQLPLPLGRKGIYLAPLFLLVSGIVATIPPRSEIARWLRRGMTGTFACLALYFVLCLRLNYFQEWEWNADVKDVYQVLACYNHAYGVADVGASWYYVSALNYYRVTSKSETFSEFAPTFPYPAEGKAIYVMNGLFEADFLKKEKLKIVYRGKSTDVVIAVRPDIGMLARGRN